jgi:ABC-type branched-subunit amino acid transport system substrate-binding protein
MPSNRSSATRLRRVGTVLAIVAPVALAATACSSSSSPKSTATTTSSGSATTSSGGPATTAGGKATGSPIKIGFIYSATGGASSSYVNSQWGAEARVDAQNDAGGVNGHPIQLEIADDTSTPAGNNLAAQEVVQQKGVFGVIEDSSLAFGGVKYLNSQKIPVTGAAVDGPEWGQQPYTNMFSVTVPTDGPIGGVNYTYTNLGVFLKDIGITSLAGAAINSPSAIQGLDDSFYAAQLSGIKNCYKNTSVPFAAFDFTPLALSVKTANCDGVLGLMGLSGDVALSSAVKQTGSQAKQVYATCYDQNLLDEPTALAASQGNYCEVSVANFGDPNDAAKTMLANLAKYTPFKGGIPSLNINFGYTAADLMIKGLEMAGSTPSREQFISNLRTVTSYDADGLLPSPVSFANFATVGMLPATECGYYVQVKGNTYVPVPADGKAVCGNRVAVP